MVITAATPEQFDAFLVSYGYTVPDESKSRLLALSLAFLRTIDICEEGATDEAQCFIAYAMSADGGGFNPVAVSDGRTVVKESLGRNAIVEEWEVSAELSGSDPVSMLKRIPMAYGLLKPLLCSGAESGVSNFELIR